MATKLRWPKAAALGMGGGVVVHLGVALEAKGDGVRDMPAALLRRGVNVVNLN